MSDDTATALGDIRVLDLTRELGSYCTKLLADLGADVIKIEPPEGDPARHVGPFYHDQPGSETSLYFFNLNTNKRSVTLNLDDEPGRDVLRRLVPTADIVVESFPPGYLDSLDLGYDAMRALRPDLIATSVTGFGSTGPHAHYAASDIVGVAMAGIMWLAGHPDDPPSLPPAYQGYLSASIQAATGTVMALYHRDVTGAGQRVDVSMQEALMIAQEDAMQTYDLHKVTKGRNAGRSALPITIPGMGAYEASDGWIWSYVGTPGGAPWSELLTWMDEEGKAENLNEEKYRNVIDQMSVRFLTGIALNEDLRTQHGPVLRQMDDVLTRFYASKPKWELYEQGQGRRLLVGIVSTPQDLAINPQLAAREWFQDVRHEALDDTIRYPGPPYRLSETPWRIARRPPGLGEHNGEVLGELGYAKEELEALAASGAM